jgi:hypothetical protein
MSRVSRGERPVYPRAIVASTGVHHGTVTRTGLHRTFAPAGQSQFRPAGVLANLFRDVERMHLMGHITDWQLANAQEAYARTVSAAGTKIGGAASLAMGKAKDP